jgi:hypothetical protein
MHEIEQNFVVRKDVRGGEIQRDGPVDGAAPDVLTCTW